MVTVPTSVWMSEYEVFVKILGATKRLEKCYISVVHYMR